MTIQSYEQAKEDYRLKWPDTYSPIDAIYILTVRATNDLAGNLLSRLDRTPALIRQGIANLSRDRSQPAETVDGEWRSKAPRGREFSGQLAEPSESSSAGQRRRALCKRRSKKRSKRVNEFAQFLERDLLPRSRGVYAVGEEHFNLFLRKKHFLDHDAAEPARTSVRALFAKTKQELEPSSADELAPGKDIEEVARKRFRRTIRRSTKILPAYRQGHGSGARFCEEKKTRLFSA